MPEVSTSTPTQEPNTSTPNLSRGYKAWETRRANAAKKHPEQATGGTALSGGDTPPADLAPPLSPREKKLVKNLSSLYGGLGVLLAGFKPLAGAIIIQGATDRATELVNVAKHHKEMFEFLEKLMESNDYISAAVGHGAMLFAIMVALDRISIGQKVALILQNTGYEEVLKVKLQELEGESDARQPVAA